MLKKSVAIFLSLLLVLAVTPFTNVQAVNHSSENNIGTTYYVSTLDGSDRDSGTSKEEAFYSLQKINNIELQPGDKVLIEAGSVFIDGYLHIEGSGAPGAPILINRYGEGPDPKIKTNGQGIWYQNYGHPLGNPKHQYKGYVSSSILLYDVEYIEINNLNISNDPNMPNEPYSSLDKMNRTGVAVVAQNKGTLDHIYLNNLKIHDIRGNVYDKHMNNGGIYFTVFKPRNPEKTGIPRFNDVKITNNVVKDVSRWGIAVAFTAYFEKFSSAELPDSIMKKYGNTHVVIRNNYVKNAGGDAITAMFSYKPLIEYNVSDGAAKEINDEVYSATDFGQVAAAIWSWKSKDALFQYNEAFDTHYNQDGMAWDADYGDGTIYQYNYSHHNAGGALMVCLYESVNTVFRYNISQNDLGGILSLPNNPEAKIYNNTFYVKEGVDFIRDGMTGGHAVISNNIIYYSGEHPKQENWTKGHSNITYSHNIYYNYKNVPSSDQFAITADPQLLNPGSGPTSPTGISPSKGMITHDRSAFSGYKLKDTSPAINSGKYIPNNGGQDFLVIP